MLVQMNQKITGYRDGAEWPEVGGVIDVPASEAALLIANGYEYMLSGKYWISFYPGIALLVTIGLMASVLVRLVRRRFARAKP